MESRRSIMALVAIFAAIVSVLPIAAQAAITTVDCNSQTDDIVAVQAAVNGAVSGDTIRLTGICSFVLAAPHGGDITSNEAAAVLIGAAGPINGLTIEGGATVLGLGLQTAFLVGPTARNVAIRGLRIVNFARAVVSINTDGTFVGSSAAGTVPDANALRIIGSATMDSAILGLAIDRNPATAPAGSVVVSYGNEGALTKTFTGQATGSLTNYTVAGNYITYAPPGTEVLGNIVAIDIRQRFERVASGIRIRNNAVGMFSPIFPTVNMNGIKLHSLTPLSVPITGTTADYYIRDVQITGNNLGRLEELPNPLADIHASGRIGIAMTGVGGFDVSGNGVRTVLTPTLFPMPGGGIVISDSGFGRISGNGINVVSTPEGENSDFGAIGVVDDLGLLFGDPAKPQPTRNVLVENNIIGTVDPRTTGIAGRGIVVANASLITVQKNRTELTLSYALNIAPILEGPGSLSAPGTIQLPATVTSSYFCNNNLDGIVDDPNEVSFGEGGGASTGNQFPGGTPPNSPCFVPGGPTLIFVPTDNTPPKVFEQGSTADSVSFHLSQRPTAPVTVTMTTDADTTPVTATLVFTPLNWNIYQYAIARAVDDLLVEGTELSDVTFSFSSADPAWNTAASVTIQYIVIDNDLGLVEVTPTAVNLAEGGTPVAYTVRLTQAPTADVIIEAIPDIQIFLLDRAPLRFTPLNWSIPQAIRITATDDNVREGTHFGIVRHRSYSTELRWNNVAIASVLATIADNDFPGAPVFTAPGDCVGSTAVILSGTGEEGATVNLYEGGVLIGSATVVGGVWTFSGTFSEGTHTVAARQTGADGVTGAHYGSITFTVDLTPPVAPVITSPADGSVVTTNPVTFTGTAEAFATVVLRSSALPIATTTADASGNWSVKVLLPAGNVTVDAVAIDCAGNVSPPSASVTITVAAPTIPTIITPAEGAFVKALVHVGGTAEPGTTVSILEGGVVIRAGIGVTGVGTWEVDITFTAGVHTITAVATAGPQTSPPSAPRTFTVDTSPPTVTIDQPPLEFLAQIVTPLDTLRTSGTATDDWGVDHIDLVYSDFLTGSTVATAVATCLACPAVSVTWENEPIFGPGLYRVSARSVDLAGNRSGLRSILLINLAL